ncbi:MAG TPA: protein kinase [Pyrinomonadaceae bacterium]|jgi:serine/threonine protein kinase/Tol biopolymer transport system component
MTIQRWQQIKEIFHASLERAPGERRAFLAQVCAGDDALKVEVESLIKAHESEGSFIDSPAYEVAAGWLAGAASDGPAPSLLGERVGRYEILAELGAGGMGEVYLAEDTTLGRKIALKLLPRSFADDAERLRRFRQEARTASALNHPNIVTIHEIGEHDGRRFIATELIEGQTLRQRLSAGPLALSEALDIILQAASAVAAAHEAGIVHRDVKPENVMLRRDGYVKVLDFGLAKLTGPKAGHGSGPEATTAMLGNTSPGVVMGTAHYMSPEQARGLATDARTDVWSLGVVLYEMLAGRAPFEGATTADVTVSILEREPAALRPAAGEFPAELDRIVRKALGKEREERYPSARELLEDLRAVKQDLEFEAKLGRAVEKLAPLKGSVPPRASVTTDGSAIITTDEIRKGQTPSPAPTVVKGRPRPALAYAALALAVLASAGFALYKLLLPDERVAHFQAVNITRLTNHGKATQAAISPDGKYFVYVLSDAGKQSLWLRQTDAVNDTQIVAPAPGGVFGVTFSRDGADLYYVIKANDAGTLYRMPVLGGTPVKVMEKIDCPVSFSPDGKQFAFVRGDYPVRGESGLFVANADGTGVRQLAARKLPDLFFPIFYTGPSWSPDGRLIACAVSNTRSEGRVVAVNVADGGEQVLTRETWPQLARVEWLPDMSGLLINARDQKSTVPQIWLLSYPSGEARKVTNDLSFYRAVSLSADASRLVTVQTTGLVNIWLVPGGDAKGAVKLPAGAQGQAAGEAVQLSIGNVGYLGGNEGISWTPDGRIVFINATGKESDIWIMNADGSDRKQLTASGSGLNHNAVVSPDGRHVVFTSGRTGTRTVWVMNIDGSDPRQLTDGLVEFLPDVSPDGQWVVYSSLDAARLMLRRVHVGGGAPVELKREGVNPVVSPDGRWIAYLYTEASAPAAPPNRIGVIPFEGGEPVKTFEIPSGLGGARTILHWSRDGRSLLYTVITNNVSNIWSQPVDGGRPTQLTDFKEHIITAFDWSRDGRQLAVARGLLIRDAVMISNSK